MKIIKDDLKGPEIAALLREHLASMAEHSPPESIHALSLEKLRKPDITFWTAWDRSELLGCGALKELDPSHGEIKSMRTDTRHLRRGVAAAILMEIIAEAKQRNYKRISLETGSMAAFIPAHKLYLRFGFTECGPFADYIEDPYSIFMTKELGSFPRRISTIEKLWRWIRLETRSSLELYSHSLQLRDELPAPEGSHQCQLFDDEERQLNISDKETRLQQSWRSRAGPWQQK